jgi:hypothetical protein
MPYAQVFIWQLSTSNAFIVWPDAEVFVVVDVSATGAVVAVVPALPPQ